MSTGNKIDIYELRITELEEILSSWGEPSYRARQTWKAMYRDLINNPGEITTLPNNLRQRLAASFDFTGLNSIRYSESKDRQTKKQLFELRDGKTIETVLMKYDDIGRDRTRRTVCISSQSGCAMGCVFCATGQMGFQRNLTSGEIVEQVLYFERLLRSEGDKLTNVVVMGMGEPLHNYEATLNAIDRLNDPNGFNFGARRFTISTVGIVPVIRKFTQERRQVNLAISLHAANDSLRSSLIPLNRKYHLDDLMSVCREYVETTHRRITFEWALIDGVNDTLHQAQELCQRLHLFRIGNSMMCHVNLIPLNPIQKYHGKAANQHNVLMFMEQLENQKIPVSIRRRRGIDINAGCGQLATKAIEEISAFREVVN